MKILSLRLAVLATILLLAACTTLTQREMKQADAALVASSQKSRQRDWNASLQAARQSAEHLRQGVEARPVRRGASGTDVDLRPLLAALGAGLFRQLSQSGTQKMPANKSPRIPLWWSMTIQSIARRFFKLAGLILLSACSQAADVPVTDSAAAKEYAALLKTYVTSGGVRYAAWKQNAGDIAALHRVADFYAGTKAPKDRDTALAWHINAYNSWILRNILAKYPTKGPLAGEPHFFHGNRIVISGGKTSFNDLEQKVIRPTFKEPRVHFALNCASASCPPLATRPFEAATLNEQLDQLARAFANGNPQAIQVSDKGVSLSKIFDWYKDDFAAAGGAVAFINRFRKEPLPTDAKVKFMDYDWSLNEAK